MASGIPYEESYIEKHYRKVKEQQKILDDNKVNEFIDGLYDLAAKYNVDLDFGDDNYYFMKNNEKHILFNLNGEVQY